MKKLLLGLLITSSFFAHDFVIKQVQTPYDQHQKALLQDHEQLSQQILQKQQSVLVQCQQMLQEGSMQANVSNFLEVLFSMEDYLTYEFSYMLTSLFIKHGLNINQTFKMSDLEKFQNFLEDMSDSDRELGSLPINIFVLSMGSLNSELLQALYSCRARPTAETFEMFDISFAGLMAYLSMSQSGYICGCCGPNKQVIEKAIQISFHACDKQKQNELLQRYSELKEIV